MPHRLPMSRVLPGLAVLCVPWLTGLAEEPANDQPPPPPSHLPQPPALPPELKNQAPVQPPPDLPDPAELTRQLEQLDELLSLSPEELQRLRQTIEFIEKMPEAQREAMRIRLRQITQMNPRIRAEIRELAALLPDDRQRDVSQFWLAASTETRRKIRKKLQARSPDQKTEFLRKAVDQFVQKRDQAFQQMRESLQQSPE